MDVIDKIIREMAEKNKIPIVELEKGSLQGLPTLHKDALATNVHTREPSRMLTSDMKCPHCGVSELDCVPWNVYRAATFTYTQQIFRCESCKKIVAATVHLETRTLITSACCYYIERNITIE